MIETPHDVPTHQSSKTEKPPVSVSNELVPVVLLVCRVLRLSRCEVLLVTSE